MATQYRRFPLALAAGVNLLTDNLVATLHSSSYAPNLDTDQFVSSLTNELTTSGGYTVGGQSLTAKTLAYITAGNWGQAWAASTAFQAGAMLAQGGYIYRATVGGTSAGSAPTWPTTPGSTVTDNGVTWMCEGGGSGSSNNGAMVWTASTAVSAGYVVRLSTSNGFLYRCTTAGATAASAPTWPTTVGATVTDGSVVWECIGAGIVVFAAANPSWSAATFTGARYVVFSDRQTGVAGTEPLVGIIDYGSGQNGQGGAFTVQLNPQGMLFFFTP